MLRCNLCPFSTICTTRTFARDSGFGFRDAFNPSCLDAARCRGSGGELFATKSKSNPHRIWASSFRLHIIQRSPLRIFRLHCVDRTLHDPKVLHQHQRPGTQDSYAVTSGGVADGGVITQHQWRGRPLCSTRHWQAIHSVHTCRAESSMESRDRRSGCISQEPLYPDSKRLRNMRHSESRAFTMRLLCTTC